MSENGNNVAVVGAGIIGLCCAFHLRRAGYRVMVVDRDLEGDRASFGNAGGIAQPEIMPLAAPGIIWKVPKYLLDPLGPLAIRLGYLPRLVPYLMHFIRAANRRRFEAGAQAMASLLATAFDDHELVLQEAGLTGLLSRKGHLWIYRSEAGFKAARLEWALRERMGFDFEILDRAGLERLEPDLGPAASLAVRSADWGHYADPKALVLGLVAHLRERGVAFRQGRVDHINVETADRATLKMADGTDHACNRLIIAAGAWSHRLTKGLGDSCPLETERGYNTTLADPGVQLNTMVTFAEDHFVATPMAMGLRIGGAVEFAGLDAPPSGARARALLKLAGQYLPNLRIDGGTEWMGHRPSTPDSLPVIGPARHHPNVFYAFGHGHLGLTGSATTGRLITALVGGQEPGIDLAPFRMGRFG